MGIYKFFPTRIYETKLQSAAAQRKLHAAILREAKDLAEGDGAGRDWSKQYYTNGYTSYASVNDLQLRSATFAQLERLIQPHIAKLVRYLDFDLGKRPLKMSTCWINIMPPNSYHGMHLHPLSVLSGTYYVQTPKGASSIKFEDPRLDRYMNTPPRKNPCHAENKILATLTPTPGKLVLFESWLRHEVPMNKTKAERISVSFNYEWN